MPNDDERIRGIVGLYHDALDHCRVVLSEYADDVNGGKIFSEYERGEFDAYRRITLKMIGGKVSS